MINKFTKYINYFSNPNFFLQKFRTDTSVCPARAGLIDAIQSVGKFMRIIEAKIHDKNFLKDIQVNETKLLIALFYGENAIRTQV